MRRPINTMLATALLAPVVSCAALQPGNWEPSVRARLDAAIERSRGNPDAYAVLDFDHTTTMGDLSYSCMWHLLEKLDLRMADFAATLTNGLPRKYEKPLSEVAALAHKLAPRAGEDLREDSDWRQLAKTYWKTYRDIYREFGDHFACKWRMRLFTGYTPEEFASLAKAAIAENLSSGRLRRDKDVPVEHRGMVFAPELLDLVGELQKAGIAVYIVSGSNKIPLLMATGPEFGFDIPPSHVFGSELMTDASGRFLADAAPNGVKTGEKAEFIRTHIAPLHNGADPVIVAGDSMGDYTMLTEFKGMLVGLLFRRNWKEQTLIDFAKEAASNPAGPIAVQGRDEPNGRLLPSHESIFL